MRSIRTRTIKLVLKALAKLNDPDVYYVICGHGPLMDVHKELAKELGVGDRVVLTGYRTDVADFYKMADIFLFPSFREGLPVSVMEAMACGLPIIATNIRGSSDIVKETMNGKLLKPNDVDGFANAISVFRNEELLNSISKINAQEAMKYDLNKTFKQKHKSLTFNVNMAPLSYTFRQTIDENIKLDKHFQKK